MNAADLADLGRKRLIDGRPIGDMRPDLRGGIGGIDQYLTQLVAIDAEPPVRSTKLVAAM